MLRSVCVAIVSICVACSVAFASPKLDEILSAPFPTSLIAAPGKDSVAWVFNHAGRRNIYVADGPEYKPHSVTNYQKDDGQELDELTFSPDGRYLVYVRGGDTNAQQQYPNPNSDPNPFNSRYGPYLSQPESRCCSERVLIHRSLPIPLP